MKKRLLRNCIVLVFVLLFLYTGIAKLWDYNAFTSSFRQSPILKVLPQAIAWIIPVSELLLVVLLLTRKGKLIGLYASLTLMILFTIYLISLNYFTDYIPCSCGGILETMPTDIHILLNIAFVGLAVSGIYLEKKKELHAKAHV